MMIFLPFPVSGAIRQKISLEKLLLEAAKNNGELKVASFKSEAAFWDMKRAKREFYPKIQAQAGAGPIPRATGNALSSSEDKSVWGATYFGSIETVWPVYTWGRRDAAMSAGVYGQKVVEQDKRIKEAEVRFNLKKSYYGALLASSLLSFVLEVEEEAQGVLENFEKENRSKKDRYRISILLSQIRAKKAEILREYETALSAMALYSGFGDGKILPREEGIEPVTRNLRPLEYYLDLMRGFRPEIKKLMFGIEAKNALAVVEKRANLPIFGVMGKYTFARTNVRQKQTSSFAYDPYNGYNLIFGVGLKWDFDFGVSQAKAGRLESEARELAETKIYADDGLALLVKKAWLGARGAQETLVASQEALTTGKKWLRSVVSQTNLGLADSKEIADAYEARASTLKNYYEAIFNHHMAWAQLSLEVGKEVDPLLEK
jgi:outer membrane protein TolC